MAMKQEDFQKKWAKVISKAWIDPAFKKKLLENPESTLATEGISISQDYHVEIHREEEKIIHLTLPEKPKGELSEEKLLKVAAGAAAAAAGCGGVILA